MDVASSFGSVSLNVAASGIKPTGDNLDIAWKWNSYKYMSKKTILCNFCFHPLSGEITRGKKHQLGITGEVSIQKKKNEIQNIADAQTKQWVRPPGMIIGNKGNISSLQPCKENVFTFSNRGGTGLAVSLDKRWFCSFHKTQTQASQMSCKKDQRVRRPPVE
ncbi:hypothetical protein QL285_063336 [Trifolium repens]|nr:hypothetical protein QL285_063336 [Trifolium repens]